MKKRDSISSLVKLKKLGSRVSVESFNNPSVKGSPHKVNSSISSKQSLISRVSTRTFAKKKSVRKKETKFAQQIEEEVGLEDVEYEEETTITLVDFLTIAKDHFTEKGNESALSAQTRRKIAQGYVSMNEFDKAQHINDKLQEEVKPLRAEFKESNHPHLKMEFNKLYARQMRIKKGDKKFNQEFYDLNEQLKELKIQNEIKSDILMNLKNIGQKKKESLRSLMFYIHKDQSQINNKCKEYVFKISDFDELVTSTPAQSVVGSDMIQQLKSINSTKSVAGGRPNDNKVATFLLTKDLELEDKVAELRLLQDKIAQIIQYNLMKQKTKTPSFSNLATFTQPINFQTLGNVNGMMGEISNKFTSTQKPMKGLVGKMNTARPMTALRITRNDNT